MLIGLPPWLGNTSGLSPSPNPRAASRISIARRHSGIRCSRLDFIRLAGTVHNRAGRSISAHRAPRTSPDRAAVSTRNSNARLTAGVAPDACIFRIAPATSPCGNARMCSTRFCCGPRTGPSRSQGVVRAVLHCHGPLHHGADALADASGSLGPAVPDAPQSVKNVGATDVRHRLVADVGEHVAGEARYPVVGVPGMAPAGAVVPPDPLGRFRESGQGLGSALLGERISALACHLAIRERLLARLLERDEREAA